VNIGYARLAVENHEEVFTMHPELDKTRLLELTRIEFAFVERTLALLTEAHMLEPNAAGNAWSVKDTVAHLTRWLDRLILWLDRVQHGQDPETPEAGFGWDEIDRMNDLYVERDKNLPLKQVIADFQRAHLEALEDVEALSGDDIFTRQWNGLRDPLWGYITSNTYEHYHEHIILIRQWMTEKGYGK
jgi:hypothetical protein